MIKKKSGKRVKNGIFKINPFPSEIENNILNQIKIVKNKKILDLFSCTGKFGIKLKQKGVFSVKFIEKNKNYTNEIKKKIKKKKFKNLKKLNKDVFKFLKLNKEKKYDLIFIDPPYEIKLFKKLFIKLIKILKKNGTIIYRRKTNINNRKIILKGFKIKKKIKKNNEIIFIKKNGIKKC